MRTWSVWALGGVGTAALLLLVLWFGPWILTRHPSSGLSDVDAMKASNDVRTTLVQSVAGLAVAAGAVITFRTYRQNQVDQARRNDRDERSYLLDQSQQVTDTYTKAVEQLGHARAPVRLGALHSLVSLAQADPARRQTVIDVLCAYLRMPYAMPADDDAAEPTDGRRAPAEPRALDAAQELQVRLTIQRLLADHLRRPEDTLDDDFQDTAPTPERAFWPGVRLDLTGATLVDLDLRGVSVIAASFTRATFSGDAVFDRASFSGDASFDGATFLGAASFTSTRFRAWTPFRRATFGKSVEFAYTVFSGEASFDEATFSDALSFFHMGFDRTVSFRGATFHSGLTCARVTFYGQAWFDGATFSDDVTFHLTSFDDAAIFDDVEFLRGVDFTQVEFMDAGFLGTVFSVPPSFDEVRMTVFDAPDLDDGDEDFEWFIPGWVVRPDADDPTRGTVVPASEAEADATNTEDTQEDEV